MANKGEAIRDFFVKLGFDPSDVTKGLASLDKEFSKFQKKLSGTIKVQQKSSDVAVRTMSAAAKVNTLNAKIDQQRLNVAREAAKVSEHQERLRLRHMRREDALLARRVATTNAIDKAGRRVEGMSGGINPQLRGDASNLNARREMLQREVATARTSSEFAKLRAAISRLNDDTTRFISNNKRMQKQLTASAYSAKALKDSLNNLARSYVSIFAVIGGGAAFVRTGQELVALKTTLLAATGNAEDAGKAFEFVSGTAMNLGVDIASATRSFAQMGVAARNAGLTLEQTQEIFTGLSEASAAFGMSTVDQERAFRSVVQMLS